MNSIALNKGLQLGISIVIYYLTVYFIGADTLFSPIVGFIPIIFYLYFMITSATATRAADGGHISLGEGFTAAWLTFVVGGLIGILFSYILYNFIDPSLKDIAIEKSMEMLEKFSGSMDEEAFEQVMEEMENKNPFSLGQLMIGYVVQLFVAAIVALIIGAAVKKEKQDWV